MSYHGIDYGLGQTNIDKKTGIRYGVISQNEVLQAWCDDSEGYYGEPSCPECSSENISTNSSSRASCKDCKAKFDDEDTYGDDPVSHYIENEEYSAECGEQGDIFITRSPYYTRCEYCSPCAPGAGYIMNSVEDGIKAYCFGHDWFEDGKAPYPVYSVDDWVKNGSDVEVACAIP